MLGLQPTHTCQFARSYMADTFLWSTTASGSAIRSLDLLMHTRLDRQRLDPADCVDIAIGKHAHFWLVVQETSAHHVTQTTFSRRPPPAQASWTRLHATDYQRRFSAEADTLRLTPSQHIGLWVWHSKGVHSQQATFHFVSLAPLTGVTRLVHRFIKPIRDQSAVSRPLTYVY